MGHQRVGQLQLIDGTGQRRAAARRSTGINGPGAVYGGVNATGAATTISYNTLQFEPRGTDRLESVKLLDLGVQKVVQVPRRQEPRQADGSTGSTCSTANTIQALLERQPEHAAAYTQPSDHRAAAGLPLRRERQLLISRSSAHAKGPGLCPGPVFRVLRCARAIGQGAKGRGEARFARERTG